MSFLDGRIDNYQDRVVFRVVADVIAEPVTLAEVKAHLRVDTADDDSLISAMALSARKLVEEYTGRRLMPRTERLLLDFFPKSKQIIIPAAPISAISAVTYYDQEGVATVFPAANYVVDTDGPVGSVVLKYGVIWPILGSLRRPINAVAVDFASGYADAAGVPDTLKLAIKLMTAHFYENRESTTMLTVAELPFGIKHVLKPYRVWEALL